jgi:hypothetical protein
LIDYYVLRPAQEYFTYMETSPLLVNVLQNLGLCSALRAFEQGGIFIVPHLLCQVASVFPVITVYDKGQCGFTLRVEAGRCGSNRFNTDIDTELKSLQKFLYMTKKVYRSQGIPRN